MNESQLRRVIRQMLTENDDYDYYSYGGGMGDVGGSSGGGSVLGKIFIKPFADVVTAARLTVTDILSALRLGFTTALRLDPKKLKEARGAYNQRLAASAREWAPIIGESYKAIAETDLGLVTLTLAPHLYYSAAIVKAGKKGVDATVEVLNRSGWTRFSDDWKRTIVAYFGTQWKEIEAALKTSQTSKGSGGDLSAAMRAFFMAESLVRSEAVGSLVEKKKKSPTNAPASGLLVLPPEGMPAEAKAAQEAMIETLREMSRNIPSEDDLKQIQDKITSLRAAESAKNLDDFIKFLGGQGANTEGLKAINLKVKEINDQASKLSADKKTVDSIKAAIAKESNKPVDVINEDELKNKMKETKEAFIEGGKSKLLEDLKRMSTEKSIPAAIDEIIKKSQAAFLGTNNLTAPAPGLEGKTLKDILDKDGSVSQMLKDIESRIQSAVKTPA